MAHVVIRSTVHACRAYRVTTSTHVKSAAEEPDSVNIEICSQDVTPRRVIAGSCALPPLGGKKGDMRVPLVKKSDVSPAQQELYDTFVTRVGANYSSFTTMTSDGALLGPWAVWMQAPATGLAIDQLLEAIGGMPGLQPRTVQSVILSVGAHFNAAYIMYAHSAVAAQIGVAEPHIAALCAGECPADLDSETRVAVAVANKLLRGGALPGPVFRNAVEELGQDGFDHLVYLVSQYCLVAMSLNAYDIPEEFDWSDFRGRQS